MSICVMFNKRPGEFKMLHQKLGDTQTWDVVMSN